MRTEKWTLKTPSGQVLTTLLVEMESLEASPATANGPVASANTDEPRMTDPQKRFLFRLLASQKVEGKQAEAHLKEYFQVSSLSEITKGDASEYINQLTKDKKDARA